MLALNDVTYKRKKKVLIKDISGEIKQGDCISLFGPNGAGKSTLLKLIAGLETPSSGTCVNENQEKISIGYVPQQLALFDHMTVRDHLTYYEKMTKQINQRYVNEMIEVLGLKDVLNLNVESLSGGMARKLNLAIGLIHEPDLILLDEAFVGVDLATKHDMLTWLHQLNEQGATNVMISHDWHVIEHIAQSMWILDDGELIDRFPIAQVDQKQREYGYYTGRDLRKMFALRR
ncbi:ABC transporter ATP-binding protein [Alkalibacillus salilacus]|uniref:ABC-2 type transport system ATP-binding protein n=1 Tax=Alkalibacillus salilacus TaxID=284582 RepID=A0ABT9VG25_9BACI|nr:ABC transporter ATP-binding protein [Alkalibacillus salilacus]MDQ0159901.1 ABC-2 type transport system ATP-binding protein [Alkalibacillus salilacus]